MNRWLRSGLVVSLLSLAVSGVAGAAVWSAPLTLQPNVNISASALDATSDQTLAAWEGNTGVWVASFEPLGGFSEQRVSAARIANVSATLLAVDSAGDAVVAWETRALPNPEREGLPPGTLYVAYRRGGRRFGGPRRIARYTEGANVGIDRRGDVTIAWGQAGVHGRRPGIDLIERHRDGRYGSPRRVVQGSTLEFSLTVDARDDAVLVWEKGTLDSAALLCATSRGGNAFGRPLELVRGQEGAGDFDVGIDAAGGATVAWEGPYDRAATGSPYRRVNVVTVNSGAHRPGRIQALRTPGRAQLGDDGVSVVVDPRGDGAAIWDADARGGGIDPRIEVARRRAGQRFAATRTVGTGDIGGGFDAALGSTGSLLVAWESNYSIRAALASGPRDPLGRPSRVSPPQDGAADPDVALTARGQGLALWQDLGPNQPQSGGSDNIPLLFAATTPGR